MFPKPEPYARVKARTKRQQAQDRARARRAAYVRAKGLCERCGAVLVLELAKATPFTVAQAHEIRKRSLGGDPLDEAQIVIVCAACHEVLTTNRERAVRDEAGVSFVPIIPKERV